MITHRAKYAIKALLYIMQYPGPGPVPANQIAADENIPAKFLEGILTELRRKGFIRSKPGRRGGHQLNREPDQIDLLSIIRAIDGPIAPLPCLSQTAYVACEDCRDEQGCQTRQLLGQVHQGTLALMRQATLGQFIGTPRPRGCTAVSG